VTDVAAPTGVDGRALSKRGTLTRQRVLDAAESVFAQHGFHDASIVKITEAAGVGQGTFYLYFGSKKDVFDELVRDLNRGSATR
jgi:AcrR family transcriptional regulator